MCRAKTISDELNKAPSLLCREERCKLTICESGIEQERELTAAWLHYGCSLSLSGLLHGSVLDYGFPLLYVIPETSNSV